VLNDGYRWVASFYRDDGTAVGEAPLAVDWEPASEWARWSGVRARGHADAFVPATETLAPRWHPEVGEPYLAGARLVIELADGERVASDLSTGYFAAAVRAATARLVERGELAEGETCRFLIAAYPQPAAEIASPPLFALRERMPELALRSAALAPFERASSLVDASEADDAPVFLPRAALAEADELALAAGARETGGVLIGHLSLDPSCGELFAEVTAQIPARAAKGELTKLTFDPATWTDVQAALRLRKHGEIMLGWWHSHPVREWCRDCAPEKRAGCRLAAGFLSAHDRALHRTVFPRAFNLALVVNVIEGDRPTHSLFGWRCGVIVQRGYRVLEDVRRRGERGIDDVVSA
jgi:hypothetical protein